MSIKVVIQGQIVEGSEQDIARLIRALGSSTDNASMPARESAEGIMPVEFAERVVTRRPLSPAQRKLFRLLMKRPDGWTLASKIMEDLDLNGNQFGGLFGAIGRRVANTEGHEDNYSLFEWQWNDDVEEHECRIHPSALPVIRKVRP